MFLWKYELFRETRHWKLYLLMGEALKFNPEWPPYFTIKGEK
jgi:hypothetical protein